MFKGKFLFLRATEFKKNYFVNLKTLFMFNRAAIFPIVPNIRVFTLNDE
jgi:hypothetical protein